MARQQAVEVAKEHIVAGDIFQVVLSQRYDIDLDADPFDFYRVLRQVNPSPYMYFLRHPDITIVGSSPEPMVQVLGRKVISRPIAGTRRRGRDDDHDRRMAGELKENPKEVAEHIMLVDLARNDVGRIAKFGSVHVDELMTLERYSHVMHLTSQVSGELVDGKTPIDVLRATLPAGTVSGAPKVRAMEIIDALEPVKRGPYAGVVGYVDFSGNLDTAIAIRTLVVRGDEIFLRSGAGVVLCPSTEANLGDGVPDLPRWLAAGVPLSVGSDSQITRAWREELRWLDYAQRLSLRRRNVAAAPEAGVPSTAQRLFDATLAGGARAAGFSHWGLSVGAPADLLVIDRDDASLLGLPIMHWLDALVFSSPGRPWRDVLCGGRWVVREHRHADADAIARDFTAAMATLGLDSSQAVA